MVVPVIGDSETMIGTDKEFNDGIAYVWTDQEDHKMELGQFAALLKRMAQILELPENRPYLTEESEMYKYKELLNDFVEASQLDSSKCTTDQFEELQALMDQTKDFTANLVPYLSDCYKKRLSFCLQNKDSTGEKVPTKEKTRTKKFGLNLKNLVRRTKKTSA